jgi:hypothetical protein
MKIKENRLWRNMLSVLQIGGLKPCNRHNSVWLRENHGKLAPQELGSPWLCVGWREIQNFCNLLFLM